MTVADPFLLAHQAGPRTFDLSGKLWPVSIRDQMVRAQLLVDRLFDQKLLVDKPNQIDSRLLVIGAGACGATAAVHAATLGASVLLIDKASHRFGFQRNSPSRWIDPAQYDWPLDHWIGNRFPWTGAKIPLAWSAGPAPRVAIAWDRDLLLAIRALPGRLGIVMDAELDGPIAFTPDKLHAHIRDKKGAICPESLEFGRLIVAVGPGSEKTAIPWPKVPGSYVGFEFWEKDPFEVRPFPSRPTNVLISGAGDGSVQDFLRLMTSERSAKLSYRKCGMPPGLARDLHAAEAIARSALHWGDNGKFDHNIHMQLDAEHIKLAGVALAHPGVLANLDAMLVNAPDKMTLVYRCDHLTCMYGLNRFLVHLIIERLKLPHKLPIGLTIAQKNTVIAVIPAGAHVARGCGVARRCFCEDHEVALEAAPSCFVKSVPGVGAWTIPANVVVIRHGLEEGDIRNLGLVPHLRPRQVLPYYLP